MTDKATRGNYHRRCRSLDIKHKLVIYKRFPQSTIDEVLDPDLKFMGELASEMDRDSLLVALAILTKKIESNREDFESMFMSINWSDDDLP